MTARARPMARRRRLVVDRRAHRAYVLVIGREKAPTVDLTAIEQRRRLLPEDRRHWLATAVMVLMGLVGLLLFLARTAS